MVKMVVDNYKCTGCGTCVDTCPVGAYARGNIPSDRELYRRLWSDPELRELCDIEEYERPYHPSQFTRFRQRMGPEGLEGLMETIIDKLRYAGVVKGEIVVCDATFIKAYNKRDPSDDFRGYSDPEARVDRAERGYQLGYKMHLAIDTCSELPLAVTAASENEKKHAPKLVEKAVKASNGQTMVLVADSQYSSRRLRKNISSLGIQPITPYPSNQNPAKAEFLRIDKCFRAHGPESLKRLYAYKASAERTISRLKQHLFSAHRFPPSRHYPNMKKTLHLKTREMIRTRKDGGAARI